MRADFSPFPTLETDRLLIRQPISADDVAYFKIRSNSEVNKYIGRKNYETIEEAQNFIVRINNNITENESVFWTIELKASKEIVGSICLWNLSIEKSEAEIGYEMHPDYFGKGIMQEAVKAIIHYGFDVMKAETIVGIPHKDHIKSIKLLERFNFKRNLEAEQFLPDDEKEILVYYALQNNL